MTEAITEAVAEDGTDGDVYFALPTSFAKGQRILW